MIGVLEPTVLMAVLALVLASGLGVERAWSLRTREPTDRTSQQRYSELVLRTVFVLCWAALLLVVFAALRLWPRVSGAMCAAGLMTEPYPYALPALYGLVLCASLSMTAGLPWQSTQRLPSTQTFWWATSGLLAGLAGLLLLFFASRNMVSGGTCCSTARVANRVLSVADGGWRWPVFAWVVCHSIVSMAHPWLQHRSLWRIDVRGFMLISTFVSYALYPYAFSQVTAPHILQDPLDTCLYCALERSAWAMLPLFGIPSAIFFAARNSEHTPVDVRWAHFESIAHAVSLAALSVPVLLYAMRTGRLVFGHG